MSGYQYYEFRTVERPLTDEEMGELRRISSRAVITRTHFSNEYNYGDLKADSHELLCRYFDLHVYVSSWGVHRFGVRFPAELVELDELDPYCAGDQASFAKIGPFVILDVWSEIEDCDWVEGEGWIESIGPVREEILAGDLRGAYLVWLAAAEIGELDLDDTEPPVPAGLATLSASLRSLAEFLRLDEHLIAAAAEGSAVVGTEPAGLGTWIAELANEEKDALLLGVASGDGRTVGIKLARRFRSHVGGCAKARPEPARSVGLLLERADVLRRAEEAQQARRAERERHRREKAAAASRAKRLDELAKRRSAAWEDVEAMLSSKKPKAYDEAIALLMDLRQLGDRDGEPEEFTRRLTSLRARHRRKRTFITRLEGAGL